MKRVFYIVTEINLKPTNEQAVYGASKTYIEDGEAGRGEYSRVRNNVQYECDGIEHPSFEAAQSSMVSSSDFDSAEQMGPGETEEFLFESVHDEVSGNTTDVEIDLLIKIWDADCRKQTAPEARTICTQTARKMAIERRKELVEDSQ